MPPPVPASLQDSLNKTKVEYTQLGSSGLRVSVPILGTMGIGSKEWMPWVVEEEEGLQVLKAVWDRGLNTWDLANVYSNGRNEEIVGKAIQKFNIPREKLVIMDKIMGTVPEKPDIFNWMYERQMAQSKDYVNQGGLSRSAIITAVNASLRRLGTDYIDLLQIHRFDPTTPPSETMQALHDLVRSGKVRYIGASSMWAYQFATLQFVAEKNGWTKFISMQNSYHLCYREEEREMLKFCKETGVGVVPWGPLFGGVLARPAGVEGGRGKMGGPVTEVDKEIVGRVEVMARKKGVSMSQVSLAWLRAKGCVPVVGVGKGDWERKLDEVCAVKGVKLEEEDLKWLEELYVPKNVVGHF